MAKRKMLMNRVRPLSSNEIDEFFDKHLPYRLLMLRSWTERIRMKEGKVIPFSLLKAAATDPITAVIGNYSDILTCGFEAGLLACRLFIGFLGLSVCHKPHLHLVDDPYYFPIAGKSCEVKVTDLGGHFVHVSSLSGHKSDLLAKCYDGASKATAHLTYASGHTLDPSRLHDASDIVMRLIETHLYAPTGRCLKL